MKISELIEELKEWQESEGDIEVLVYDDVLMEAVELTLTFEEFDPANPFIQIDAE